MSSFISRDKSCQRPEESVFCGRVRITLRRRNIYEKLSSSIKYFKKSFPESLILTREQLQIGTETYRYFVLRGQKTRRRTRQKQRIRFFYGEKMYEEILELSSVRFLWHCDTYEIKPQDEVARGRLVLCFLHVFRFIWLGIQLQTIPTHEERLKESDEACLQSGDDWGILCYFQ